ncbi:hypothetical protein HYALB_00013651 [Hymenoscyphus albidus]|uniref:DNA (cytosine-5-)-methyltransferase n=1 Tax=Hymenoscyphus albidus TaxID=595503 RepID=A0A9N9QAP5_9HELO|nr:hypothetical protein HYALB_00013651 [Hymenoscyphus albidus]
MYKRNKNTPNITNNCLKVKYSYVCGAGGATLGAHKAGFDIKCGMDKDSNAAQTWEKNFPQATHYREAAEDFVANKTRDYHVDVLHMSPPCQNRKNGIKIFQEVLNHFTRRGYSITWQVLDGANYGLPASRRIFILMAAAPGEMLPDFPKPTHSGFSGSKYDGLLPFATEAEILDSIAADAPNHDLARARDNLTLEPEPRDPKELMQCIMTDGGKSKYFYDGSRKMTDRELAACQSFPNNYELFGKTTSVRTQIGNAVAPIFAEAIYGRVRKSLEDFDALNAKYNSKSEEDKNDVEMGNDRVLGLMKNLSLATSELDDDSKKINVKVRI